MNPKRFLQIAGPFLIIIGLLGIVGIFGKISDLGFFHPPYWINFIHLLLGIFILVVAFKGNKSLQANVTLIPAILATTIGILGLLFGSYAAKQYNIPELVTDPSDHIAHLIVGLVAFWAWRNRK